MKKIFEVVVITIDVIYIIWNIFKGIESLHRKAQKGIPCKKLHDGKCTSVWMEWYYLKKGRCEREKCPGFVSNDKDGSKILGPAGIAGVFLEQLPAIASVVLLLVELFG